MKKMQLLFCLMTFTTLNAQQYLIRYDVAAEDIRYFKIKKPGDTTSISVIHLSQSNRVNLQLVNLSNSYQRSVILHEKIELPEVVIIPGFATGNFDFLKGMATGEAGSPVESVLNDALGIQKSLIGDDRKIAISTFNNNYSSYKKNYSKWAKAILFEQDCNNLWKNLASVQYSFELTAKKAKYDALMKTKAVFPNLSENPNFLELKTSVVDPNMIVSDLKADQEKIVKSYQSLVDMGIVSKEPELIVKQIATEMNTVLSRPNSDVNIDNLLQRIADLYRNIMSDTYSQLTVLPINRKTVMAEIQFIPKIDSVTEKAIGLKRNDTITRWVNIYKKDQLRFKNTFGFSFASFKENQYNYFIKNDSTVAREAGDYYQPLFSTYLHFYSPKDKGFRWGGTIGAGYPISGDEKKINLLMGLSTFLGKDDPVSISLGISGAKAKKISGISLGDKVESTDYILKYQDFYRIGFFVGISFNPAALSSKN